MAKPPATTDIHAFLARLTVAADLAGITPGSVCHVLFNNYRLPERMARQAQAIEARAAKLDAHIAKLRAAQRKCRT